MLFLKYRYLVWSLGIGHLVWGDVKNFDKLKHVVWRNVKKTKLLYLTCIIIKRRKCDVIIKQTQQMVLSLGTEEYEVIVHNNIDK